MDTRLPETAYERLVGRVAELDRINSAWDDGKINILSLIAEGGAGKSALINEWLIRLQADSYRGAAAVLGWSFYSQGSKERATLADAFLDWALDRLRISIETTSASVKADAIAETMAKRRVLLILDGVEPNSAPPASTRMPITPTRRPRFLPPVCLSETQYRWRNDANRRLAQPPDFLVFDQRGRYHWPCDRLAG
jgi:hypothetical protein